MCCGSTASSLYDRVRGLLVTYDLSDCCFSVSKRKFTAHKLILAITSPVFKAMFYGPLSTNDDIIVTDIEPDIFQLILNFIYTDCIEISSVEQAFELIYASKKYLLDALTNFCVEYIKKNISIDSVISVLNYPNYLQDKTLIKSSCKMFCEFASHLLHEQISSMSCSCLKTILASDEMNIDEKDLVKYVFEWTTYHCRENNISETFENKRSILIKNGLFQLLRFSALSTEELDEIFKSENNLLLLDELENMKNIKKDSRNDKIELGFIDLNRPPREILQLQSQYCHRNPLRSAAPITVDSIHNTIKCKVRVNKSLFVKSLHIPTRISPGFGFIPDEVYSEKFILRCEFDSKVCTLVNFNKVIKYNSVLGLVLPMPFFMKRDKWYKFTFLWSNDEIRNDEHSYFSKYRDRFHYDKSVTFEFDDISRTSLDGSFLLGFEFCL